MITMTQNITPRLLWLAAASHAVKPLSGSSDTFWTSALRNAFRRYGSGAAHSAGPVFYLSGGFSCWDCIVRPISLATTPAR